jgi:hypothetical protein
MGAILKKDIYTDPSEDRILPYNGQAFFTLNRINNGHMTQKAYKLDQLEFVLSHIANDRDTYMAQGFFSRPCRRALFIETMTHAYVDIDCYKTEFFPGWMTRQQKVQSILSYCDDNFIPVPSAIISSGRGIYLKWYWASPIPREAVGRAVALNKQLVSLFAPLGADPACVDVSRILRVVGTLNSKNNQPVELLHQTDRDGHAITYVFDDFADEVLPYSLEQIREWREAQKQRYEAKGQVIHLAREKARERLKAGNRKAFNRFDWCWRVVEDIRTIADKKYGGVIPYCEESGHVAGPDMYAHIGASMLGNIIPSQQLWPEIRTWAGLILPASYVNDKRNLLAHSSTLLKKAKQVANMTEEERIRNEEAGLNRKGAYRYKTQTIIDRLGITSDDMRNFNLKVLIDKDEKRRRDRENTMHKRREAGVMERVEWLNASNNKIAQALSTWPNEKKLTQQALADATGLSVRTVRTHWKK